MMRRGFTIIELMIAGSISLIVIAGAFLAMNRAHRAAQAQERSLELVSQGRIVLDLIGRDIRSAGDSVQLLPEHCLQGQEAPGAPFGCPAVFEPHPWRVSLARYMWDEGPDGVPFTADDELGTTLFDANPNNVVLYQFVPSREIASGEYRGFLGRLERIVNPYGFAGQDPERRVLLDNVLLDNRMAVSPDGREVDSRRDFALFMYRLMSVQYGEYEGDAFATQRSTKEGSFILPPARFFSFPDISVADTWAREFESWTSPYLPASPSWEIVGLRADGSTNTSLRPGKPLDEDLRYILDFNRIRAIQVSFKLVESQEDPDYEGGVDLDPRKPGTARAVQMESTFEIKVFSGYLY